MFIVDDLWVPTGTIRLLLDGCSARAKTFWTVPTLGTSVIAMGVMAVSVSGNPNWAMPKSTVSANVSWLSTSLYLTDVYSSHAASALAASTIVGSIAAATIPLSGPALYEQLDYGWGNSVLGCIAFALAVPLLLYL